MARHARSIDRSEVSISLGIVVEKRASNHPWADYIWMPVSVFLNADPKAKWQEMMSSKDCTRYHAGTLLLTLHRKETEALRSNLMLAKPELYIVLQEDDTPQAEFPFMAHAVTASAHDAQDMMDAGDDIVEKVAMPEAVAVLIQAFVEEHHVEEEFINRKLDRLKLEDQNFGKDPIFTNPTKH